jgi:hypothetical protein
MMAEWLNRLTIGNGNMQKFPITSSRLPGKKRQFQVTSCRGRPGFCIPCNLNPACRQVCNLNHIQSPRLRSVLWQVLRLRSGRELFHLLHINQLLIKTVLGDQLIVCAAFNDLTFL